MYSFNRYLLSIYYVFGTILNTWNTMLYNRDKVFSSFSTYILVGKQIHDNLMILDTIHRIELQLCNEITKKIKLSTVSNSCN